MTDPDLPAITTELADLLRQRLGVRGADFRTRLRRAGRLLPRAVRKAGWRLVEMETLWDNHKLRRRIDALELARAAKTVRDHLTRIDAADRRKGYWLGVLTPLAFNLLLTAGLIALAVAWWPRGTG